MSNNVAQRLDCTGLRTAPNPHTKRPKGSMVRADEVVCRRDGMLEPRPGFKQLSRAGDGTYDGVEGLIPFDDDVAVQSDGRMYSNRVDAEYVQDDGSGGEDPSRCWFGAVRGIQYGDALYFCGQHAPRKLFAADGADDYTVQTGAPIPNVGTIDAVIDASGWFAAGESVAYRAVIVLVDEADREVRSSPSGRFVVTNGGVDDLFLDVTVQWPWMPALHRFTRRSVELYRSKKVTGTTPSDELFLVLERELSDAEVAAKTVTISDEVGQDDLGRQLYTNPSQGGIERANFRPPHCQDFALFAGNLFALRLQYPYRYVLRYQSNRFGTVSVSAATFTATSAVITGVTLGGGATWADLYNGMALIGATHVTGGAYIVDFDEGAATITIDHAASGTGADPFTLEHALHIQTNSVHEVFPISTASSGSGLVGRILVGHEAEPTKYPGSANVVAYVIGQGSAGGVGNVPTVVIETPTPDPAAGGFLLAASFGEAYLPELTDPTDGIDLWAFATAPDTQAAGAWSKNGEPEHFLGVNGYRIFGHEHVAALRCFATLDGLWVLKGRGDGIYRLTGFGERLGWRVEQVSRTICLLHPGLAASLGETIYAWTNEGAVEISSSGIRHISKGVVGIDTAYLEQTLWYGYIDAGAWCCADAKNNEIAFGLPHPTDESTWDDFAARIVYVFNARTRAWTKRHVGNTAISAMVTCDAAPLSGEEAAAAPIVFGTVNVEENLRIERATSEDVTHADEEYTPINVVAVDDSAGDGTTVVTIGAGSGWTPAVGDVLRQDDEYMPVVAVESATVFTVEGSPATEAPTTAYVAYECALVWQPEFGAGPAATKRFAATTAHFDALGGVASVGMTAEATPNAEIEQAYARDYAHDFDPETPADVRMLLPRSAGMGQRLYAGLKVRQADARFRVSGLTIEYRDTGRVSSR